MKEKIVPYIGVTGFTSRGEVQTVLGSISPWLRRNVMIGVLANSGTISGASDNGSNRYPTPGQMGDIFEDTSRALNLVHFSMGNPEALSREMERVFLLAGPYCNGIYLNIAWPDPKVLGYFKTRARPATIVLQIGARALEMVEYSPQKLADKIEKEYKCFIDFISFSLSSDTGEPLNPEEVRGYLRALEKKQMSVGLGVAGEDLSPATLRRLVGPLVKEFPDLSVDIEAGARNNNDLFDTRLAVSFIRKAECLFG